MDAFFHNVKENDKVLLVTGLLKHIGNGEGTPYNLVWKYINSNYLLAYEFKNLDFNKDRIYMVFTRHQHRFDMEMHFSNLRKANKTKVMTIKPQIPTFISDLRLKNKDLKGVLFKA